MNFAGARAKVTMIVRGNRVGKNDVGLPRRPDRSASSDRRPARSQVTALRAEDGHLAKADVADAGRQRGNAAVTTLFICIGGKPHSEWCAAEGVLTNTAGYILTGLDLLRQRRRPAAWPLDRDPLPLETSRAGVFAAGDVRYGSTKRVAGAVGDGAMAVALAFQRLAELGMTD